MPDVLNIVGGHRRIIHIKVKSNRYSKGIEKTEWSPVFESNLSSMKASIIKVNDDYSIIENNKLIKDLINELIKELTLQSSPDASLAS